MERERGRKTRPKSRLLLIQIRTAAAVYLVALLGVFLLIGGEYWNLRVGVQEMWKNGRIKWRGIRCITGRDIDSIAWREILKYDMNIKKKERNTWRQICRTNMNEEKYWIFTRKETFKYYMKRNTEVLHEEKHWSNTGDLHEEKHWRITWRKTLKYNTKIKHSETWGIICKTTDFSNTRWLKSVFYVFLLVQFSLRERPEYTDACLWLHITEVDLHGEK